MHHGTIPPSASLVHEAVLHSFRDGKKGERERERDDAQGFEKSPRA